MVRFALFTLLFLGPNADPHEREKMNEFCNQIQTEKNPQVFDQLSSS